MTLYLDPGANPPADAECVDCDAPAAYSVCCDGCDSSGKIVIGSKLLGCWVCADCPERGKLMVCHACLEARKAKQPCGEAHDEDAYCASCRDHYIAEQGWARYEGDRDECAA